MGVDRTSLYSESRATEYGPRFGSGVRLMGGPNGTASKVGAAANTDKRQQIFFASFTPNSEIKDLRQQQRV
ncbi:hypothetical protein LC612_34535 [Nostoc sp. CHAB 5834]|nr:hypothetical protein [Nostoc sp. CHAB 5834]